jgi:hypothetical protein
MDKELTKAFHKIKYTESSNLAENIWSGIVVRNRRIARLKLWIFSFMGFTSFIGLIPAWYALSSDLTQSGFYEYFSLIFSSDGSIFTYWKEFALSIAESLPTTSIALSLSLVFVLLISLRYVARQIINNNQFLPQGNLA